MKVNSELASLLRKRTSGWPSNHPGFVIPAEAIKFMAPISLIDERHYEVFKTGDLLRDVEFEEMSKPQASFDGRYDFDLTPVLTKDVKADRSYMVRLVVRSTSDHMSLQPPEAGTQISLKITISKGQAETEFQGTVIASSPLADEDEVTMMVTRKTGSTGLVLQGHRGLFPFGTRGTPSKQITRSIRQAMWGGDRVPIDNWMKHLLLAHDPMPKRDPHFIPDLEAFLEQTKCTSQQRLLIRRVFTFGNGLEHKVTIGQGPPGTAKTHVILIIMIWCLRKNYPVLLTAGSNIAVDEFCAAPPSLCDRQWSVY